MSVRVEQPVPNVHRIVLDRPPVNALDVGAGEQLLVALEAVERDLAIRCVIFTGAGGAFTAGADLREQQGVALADRGAYLDGIFTLIDRIDTLRVPVIAAIDGPCFGGGLELALACDLRVASTRASFGASGVNVGLIGSFQRLPRTLGLGRAMEMLLTGATYDAERAERWGLITAMHAPERFEGAVLELAQRIASRAPFSVEETKDAALRAFDMTPEQARAEQIARFVRLSATQDHVDAVAAFAESKPTPDFQRR
jgi:enoyl-CoA hydratase